ncbi:MAG: peptidoglycan-binding domain-containing protein [Aestuariivita sp.]|uniref:peptidoglycan-binding domain-containing protein n=1 Tax=Aestuariivita sp. TaxID=1872407 RepID=UPI003BAF8156
MLSKTVSTALVAAALAFSPASKAAADAGDFVAGALIGGVVGHALTKESQRKKTQTTTTTRSSARSTIPSTTQGREIQSSLNYFGFNAGGVDGQLGRRSREAVARYQVYMGYPATGQLTVLEEDILLTSYNRAQLGSFEVTQQMATHPDGARGLLKTYRTELAGGTTQTLPQTAAALPNLGVTAASSATGLPNFQALPLTTSLAAHCNSVSLVTTSNGGYTNAATMTDPDLVLNEQFCLARTYAIENSQRLAAQVPGLTPDQIAQQCEGLAPTMASYVTQLPSTSQANVNQEVQAFISSTGMSLDQLRGTGKICLGVGYRTDNMSVALGSALLLVGVGEGAYAELVGHHLMRGYGVAPSRAMANEWFDRSFNALSGGVVPVFNPGEPGRTALLQQAVAQSN